MIVVKPAVEIWFHYPQQVDLDGIPSGSIVSPTVFLERAGRLCYKSEDKITEGSAGKFVEMLTKRGHHAMLEHCVASVKFICSRGETHELVRHRVASYAQECVVGATCIHRKYTIQKLYERQESGVMGEEYNRRLQLRSEDANGAVVPNRVVKVMHKGMASVFRVRTRLGYEIEATENHEFKTASGFVKLGQLRTGCEVMVNGRPCLVGITDSALSKLFLEDALCPLEIAEKVGAPYRSVLNKLKRLGIFVKHKNDKDTRKYNKNHTVESIAKMRVAILQQYQNGRVVWNKGVSEDESEGVARQARGLRTFHHDNQPGDKNSNWQGGVSRRTGHARKRSVNECELCGSVVRLHVHHIDKNPQNNQVENLIKVCSKCHGMVENTTWWRATQTVADTIVSIEPSGEKEVFDLEMAAPYHNYIANGFVVHNSTRYCSYNKNKFENQITVIQPPFLHGDSILIWSDTVRVIEDAYMRLIKLGEPAQLARSVLPISLKTEIWATANLREWQHIFSLRCAKPAHPQIRELMLKTLSVFRRVVPAMFEEQAKGFGL